MNVASLIFISPVHLLMFRTGKTNGAQATYCYRRASDYWFTSASIKRPHTPQKFSGGMIYSQLVVFPGDSRRYSSGCQPTGNLDRKRKIKML